MSSFRLPKLISKPIYQFIVLNACIIHYKMCFHVKPNPDKSDCLSLRVAGCSILDAG